MDDEYKSITLCSLTPAALSRESCEKAINWFEENINRARPGGAGDEEELDFTLDNLELQIRIEEQEAFLNLDKAIIKGLNNFKKKYPLFVDQVEPYTLNTQDILLCKWEPNKYYDAIHCEQHPLNNRMFSWMIYLNDIKHGGGTEFIYQEITTKPKAGNFIIFPSGASHMHRGVNAPYETKYTITGHFIFCHQHVSYL